MVALRDARPAALAPGTSLESIDANSHDRGIRRRLGVHRGRLAAAARKARSRSSTGASPVRTRPTTSPASGAAPSFASTTTSTAFSPACAKLRMTDPALARRGARDPARLRWCRRGCCDAYVAMVCTRGVPPRGARDPRLAHNRFYAYALPYVWIAPPREAEGRDRSARQRALHIGPKRSTAVKNYHSIDLVLSIFDAYERGPDTAASSTANGHVAEGPGFNVFMVQGRDRAHAPTHGVLEGVSRRTVIELCRWLGIPLRIESCRPMLAHADEVFLSSTGGGILPIAKIDGRAGREFPGPSPDDCGTPTGRCAKSRATATRSRTERPAVAADPRTRRMSPELFEPFLEGLRVLYACLPASAWRPPPAARPRRPGSTCPGARAGAGWAARSASCLRRQPDRQPGSRHPRAPGG